MGVFFAAFPTRNQPSTRLLRTGPRKNSTIRNPLPAKPTPPTA